MTTRRRSVVGVAPPGAHFPSSALAPMPSSAPLASAPVATFPNGADAQVVDVTWPTQGSPPLVVSGEQRVLATSTPSRALDVYLSDSNLILPGMVLSVRIYALNAGSQAALVASGRVGHHSLAGGGGGQVIAVPLWVAAARVANATQFLVTFEVEGTTLAALPAGSGQRTTLTIVASDSPVDVPPLLGAVRLGPTASGTTWTTPRDAELLMLQGLVGAAVATPRYIHVHERTGAIAGLAPTYVFPLGAGVAAAGGGGFGGTFWFPPGLRPYGVRSYQIAISSVALTTTAVADCPLQGLVR